MGSRKYELTNISMEFGGRTLYRIRALKDFSDVKAGDLGGYDVIVDGIVGPWFLEPWRALVREDYEVHYIVLRAIKEL